MSMEINSNLTSQIMDIKSSTQGATRRSDKVTNNVEEYYEKLCKKFHGMGLTNIQRCARKYRGDIDIVIDTSKQEQQIFNLTIMLNGKPVGP